ASIIVKLLVTMLLISKLGLLAIAIASCCGWCTASIIVVLRYRGNKWKERSIVKMNRLKR
ncbi:MAG: hypothetical protein PHT76_02670, partial [Anaerostipes sp.]|nr:hypothetical protein [Anaerostipes sp.]